MSIFSYWNTSLKSTLSIYVSPNQHFSSPVYLYTPFCRTDSFSVQHRSISLNTLATIQKCFELPYCSSPSVFTSRIWYFLKSQMDCNTLRFRKTHRSLGLQNLLWSRSACPSTMIQVRGNHHSTFQDLWSLTGASNVFLNWEHAVRFWILFLWSEPAIVWTNFHWSQF